MELKNGRKHYKRGMGCGTTDSHNKRFCTIYWNKVQLRNITKSYVEIDPYNMIQGRKGWGLDKL